MGKTGDDAFGRTLRGVVASRSDDLARGMKIAAGEHTSYTVILSPQGADRMFLHCPGCNDTFGAEDIDYSMVSRARLLHFGYPPLMRRLIEDGGRELVVLLRRAKETGVIVSLDMTMPDPDGFSGSVDWPSILTAALPFVDIFLPSLDETLFTLDPAEWRRRAAAATAVPTPALLDSVARRLLALGPSIVGLKLGEHGIYLRTGPHGGIPDAADGRWVGRELWAPCFQVDVIGTTGAGDATIAGFLAGLLRNLGPEDCLTAATAVGACSVEAPDALGGVLPWEPMLQRVSRGWPRRAIPVGRGPWRRHESSGLWHGPSDPVREGTRA
jgi:sugar/nucleoside kinase (ribokinase family)